jgi:hypothetical protein
MKFDWQYRYVDGGIKPDKHGRWALDLNVFVKIDKNLKNYKQLNATFGKYIPTRVATIRITKAQPKYKFYVKMLCVSGTNIIESTFYSNDVEELKTLVEKEFINLKNFFKNCR